MSYYVAKVKVHHQDDKGRVKKVVEQYLVHAVSVTDAEAKVVGDFKGSNFEFEVTAVVDTKIISVIQ
tara:strand:+ start:2902 stop:3102 length:201 start_codon:yes stop_codon:yes gene_type:complete